MIDKLNHYSLTNPSSVYDEEALTALELAGRTAQKVNECIDELNDGLHNIKMAVQRVEDIPNEVDDTFDERIPEVEARINQEVVNARRGVEGAQHPNLQTALHKEIGYRTNVAYIGFDDVPTVKIDSSNILRINSIGDVRIYHNGNITNVKLRVSQQDISDSLRYKIIYNPYNPIDQLFTLIPWSTRTNYQYEYLVGMYCYGEAFWNTLEHNKKYLGIDSRRPMQPLVWTDTQPTWEEEDQSDEDGFKAVIRLHTDNIYIMSPFNSYTIPAGTYASTIYDNVALYRIVLVLGDIDYIENGGGIKFIPHNVEVEQDHLVLGYLHRKRGVYLNGCQHHTVNETETLPPIILGWGTTFINFNSSEKTITIPRDSMFFANTQKGYNQTYYLASTESAVTVSFADCTSSAMKLLYDMVSRECYCTNYNGQKRNANDVIIATFRNTGAVSINAPYEWDGKPFNINIESTTSAPATVVNDNIKLISHRGYTPEAPENTLSAIRKAWEKGYKYVEIDVRQSSDDVWVVIHDETVDRTSDGTGYVSDITLEGLKTLDFGSWFSSDYAGESIPTFREALTLCKQLGLKVYVEIKDVLTDRSALDLSNIVNKLKMNDGVTWISFNLDNLNLLSRCAHPARVANVFKARLLVDNAETLEDLINNNALTEISNYLFSDCGYSIYSGVDYESLLVDTKEIADIWGANDLTKITDYVNNFSGITTDTILTSQGVIK